MNHFAIGDEIMTYHTLKMLNPVKHGAILQQLLPHSTRRKTVTATDIFMASEEEQHQSLHYST